MDRIERLLQPSFDIADLNSDDESYSLSANGHAQGTKPSTPQEEEHARATEPRAVSSSLLHSRGTTDVLWAPSCACVAGEVPTISTKAKRSTAVSDWSQLFLTCSAIQRSCFPSRTSVGMGAGDAKRVTSMHKSATGQERFATVRLDTDNVALDNHSAVRVGTGRCEEQCRPSRSGSPNLSQSPG